MGPAEPQAFFLLSSHVKGVLQTMETFALLAPDQERAAMQFVQENTSDDILTYTLCFGILSVVFCNTTYGALGISVVCMFILGNQKYILEDF
jgi:hypothetical protein